jgi:hypothetical protein
MAGGFRIRLGSVYLMSRKAANAGDHLSGHHGSPDILKYEELDRLIQVRAAGSETSGVCIRQENLLARYDH